MYNSFHDGNSHKIAGSMSNNYVLNKQKNQSDNKKYLN